MLPGARQGCCLQRALMLQRPACPNYHTPGYAHGCTVHSAAYVNAATAGRLLRTLKLLGHVRAL